MGVVNILKLDDKSVVAIYHAVKAKEKFGNKSTEGAVHHALAEALVVDKSKWDHI